MSSLRNLYISGPFFNSNFIRLLDTVLKKRTIDQENDLYHGNGMADTPVKIRS
jgi:hypothetical protein